MLIATSEAGADFATYVVEDVFLPASILEMGWFETLVLSSVLELRQSVGGCFSSVPSLELLTKHYRLAIIGGIWAWES